MRTIVIAAGVIGTLAVLGGGAAFLLLRLNGQQVESTIRLFGNVEIREVQLAFEASGRIEQLLAEEGDQIGQGELVGRLNTHLLKPQLARAEAQVAGQEQVVQELQEGTRPEEIRSARANVALARAKLRQAERTLGRTESLMDDNAASQQELDIAREAFQTAEAQLEAEEARLDLALAGPRDEEVAAARAQLRLFQAERQLAAEQLADAELRSPVDGVIRQRILEPGDLASPTRPVFTLARTDQVWVRAFLPEPSLGKVRPGMRAVVRTDSFPDKVYEGWVGFISATAEFTPKTVQTEELRSKLVYEIRIHVRNPEQELRLGMPVTVEIPLHQDTAQGPLPERSKQQPASLQDTDRASPTEASRGAEPSNAAHLQTPAAAATGDQP